MQGESVRETQIVGFSVFLAHLVLALLLSAPARVEAGNEKGWVLLCSSENQLEGLTRRSAARLFLLSGEMVVSGRKVVPVNLESLEARLSFLSALTHLPPHLVERHFLDLKFRREGDWPAMVSGPNQMIQKLKTDPALIGWLPVETVNGLDAKALEGLRILKVDGKDASAADYVLRPK